MTTYTLQGYLLTSNRATDTTTAVSPTTLSIVVPDGTTGFSYTVDYSNPNEFDNISLSSPVTSITLDGVTYTGADIFSVEALFGVVTWSGGTTYLLDLYDFNATQNFDYTFVIGGTAFPSSLTVAEFNAIEASATSLSGVTSGIYAPNTEIAFANIPGIETTVESVTLTGTSGDDTLVGGDGADTLIGGAGDDVMTGGTSTADLRDVMYGGDGNDTMDGGYGNDELRGDAGDDTMAGGFGADTLIGGAGNDVMTGSAFGDLLFGGDGMDFVNGGWGHDRVNGGADADRFFHVGIFDHGSDWIQDYDATEGDVLLFGNASAGVDDFQVNFAHTATPEGERSGDDNVEEAFVIYRPTGQIMWALVDGGGQGSINIVIDGTTYDLLA